MSKKLIFFVHRYDYETRGGVLKVITMLSNEFIKSSDVEIISFGKIVKLPYNLNNNVVLTSLNQEKYDTRFFKGVFKVCWFFSAFYLLIKIIGKRENAIFLTTSPPLNIIFALIKTIKSKIMVVGCDHTSASYKNTGLIGKFKFYLYRKLNYIVALTNDDNDIYRSKNINSIYIPNPIEDNVIKNRNSYNNKLIFVGRFSKEKRPDLALNAYYKSKLWMKNIHFYMYGYGGMADYLLELVSKYSISNFVHIITDEFDPEVIYKDAYALILTSEVEGFGMVLLEAISRNIPCISFNAPFGPKNIIIDGVNGYLVDDIQNIYNFLNVEKISVLKEKEIKSSIQKFNMENVLKIWFEIFKVLEK